MRIVTFFLLMVSSLLLMSCSGGGGSTLVHTNPGKVVDGYVQGAWIYIVPVGQATTAGFLYKSDAVTDKLGNFAFTGIQAFLDANAATVAYQMISVGGTNTATGTAIPEDTIYVAPLGAKVLTPLTTLVMQTATLLAGSGPITSSIIDDAVAKIAAAAGITGDATATVKRIIDDAVAKIAAATGTTGDTTATTRDIMLNVDPMANASSSADASKALALGLIIMQLAEHRVADTSGSFSATVSALAEELVNGSPMDIVTLVTDSALPDASSQARASIISQSILNTVNQITAAVQSQSSLSSTSAEIMTQMETTLTTNLAATLSSVDDTTDAAAAVNAVTNATTATVISANITNLDKTSSAADMSDPKVTAYLVKKASDGGIAQLLGIDLLPVPAFDRTWIEKAAGKLADSRTLGKKVGFVSNPCSGVANAVLVPISCSDLLGAPFCAAATGDFKGRLSCSGGQPATITLGLTGFSSPAFGAALNGTISLNSNTMTFIDLKAGTTTFNGSLVYGLRQNGSLDLAVKYLTVVSPMWQTLTLDDFSRASITPAGSTVQNRMTAYISGTGTVVGTAAVETIAMKYDRAQDAVKISNPDNTLDAPPYIDHVTVSLNGQVSAGGEVVTLSNFGLKETRYFAAAADQGYLYKLSSFTAASKLATSKYGYAFFVGNNLKFDNTGYISGRLTFPKPYPL